ncbi:uncharacterized protein LOC130590260 [Beta vulgaris subsp. vulgaris]|uniref:uncharacterized protein LOC130590260 n=1 Tax=Beta vulgaris subsp. vulgaris TaxID=3555 RepID=UPI00254810EE|nr:uncharacterized protein LOC130590260 [Beta vulgaris subsp. vulgaris]
MLFWNLAHEILPVGSVLHSKIPSFNALCCLYADEPSSYLSRLPNSALLWTEILSSRMIPSNFDYYKFRNLPWNEWLLFQFNFNDSWLTIFITCIWHLWRSRNKAVFEGAILRTNAMINLFWYDLRSTNLVFQESTSTVPPLAISLWAPPPTGYIKLNIDGAWKAIDSAGGGGVFRKPDSSWYVGFSAKYFASSPLAAELMALKDGLTMAQDFNMECLIIETDALEMKAMLTNVENFQNSALVNLIRDISAILNSNPCYSLMHSKILQMPWLICLHNEKS